MLYEFKLQVVEKCLYIHAHNTYMKVCPIIARCVWAGLIVTGGQDAKILVHDLDADGMLQ